MKAWSEREHERVKCNQHLRDAQRNRRETNLAKDLHVSRKIKQCGTANAAPQAFKGNPCDTRRDKVLDQRLALVALLWLEHCGPADATCDRTCVGARSWTVRRRRKFQKRFRTQMVTLIFGFVGALLGSWRSFAIEANIVGVSDTDA